jgi:hypothetical protein
MNRQRWSVVAALALVTALAGVGAAPARADVVGSWVCDPQLDFFSPGGPSMGGSDGRPTVLAPTATARARVASTAADVVEYGVRCGGNAASGWSVGKPGDTWALVGQNLTQYTVLFDGTPIALSVDTDELLEFVLPPRPEGEYRIEVRLPDGKVYGNGAVIYRTPGPTITHVVDLTGGSGSAGHEILVTGARLFESTIRVDDLPVPIVHGSNTATALRFTMPDLPTGAGGSHRLDLASHDGVTVTTFTTGAPRPAGPVITGMENDDHANLTEGYVGAGMTIRGWGLAGAQVRVGGVAAQVLANFDDALRFVMPRHALGEVDVTVTNRLGSTFTGAWYLQESQLPKIVSVTPEGTSSPVVHAGDRVVLTGSRMGTACLTVDDGYQNDEGQILSHSSSRLVWTIGPHQPAEDVPVRVITSTGRAIAFVNYDLPVRAPSLAGLVPATGSTSGGVIRVKGTGLSPLTVTATVEGRAIPAAYLDAGTVELLVPRHVAGTVPVTVTVGNAHRSTTTTFNYRYLKPRT